MPDHPDGDDVPRSLGDAMAEMARLIEQDHGSVDETLTAYHRRSGAPDPRG